MVQVLHVEVRPQGSGVAHDGPGVCPPSGGRPAETQVAPVPDELHLQVLQKEAGPSEGALQKPLTTTPTTEQHNGG